MVRTTEVAACAVLKVREKARRELASKAGDASAKREQASTGASKLACAKRERPKHNNIFPVTIA